MSFLLDTHILLWFLANDSKLSNQVREVIINPKNLIFVSAISAWEISIKQSLGKLIARSNLEEALRFSRLEVLPMTLTHGIKVADLPMHHNLISYSQKSNLLISIHRQTFFHPRIKTATFFPRFNSNRFM